MNNTFYAIKCGRRPGVYESWEEAREQVIGWPEAAYKKFDDVADAYAFLEGKQKVSQIEPKAPDFPPNTLVCFTDGSTINNGRVNAVGGFAVVWPFAPEYDASEFLPGATNNRAEYSAVIHALRQADEMDPSLRQTLIIYSDSMLLINSMTKWITKWKRNGYQKADGTPVLNIDLVKKVAEGMAKRVTILKHVKAHTNAKTWEAFYNHKVDRLAVKGTKEGSLAESTGIMRFFT